MFKFFFYLNILVILIILIIFITRNEGSSLKFGFLNNNRLQDETPWPNLWFPHPPNYHDDKVNARTANVAEDQFIKENATDNGKSTDWPGLWFPHPPNYKGHKIIKDNVVKLKENVNRLHDCDSGKYGLAIDFDPQDKRHSYNYICLDKRSNYAPNLNTSAILNEYLIPAAFKPPLKCLNESIEYSETIPTFGAYRPLAPKFGSYQYLPPQRWLHSLADGAIVLLYHPCAFAGQIKELQNTVKGCLYRHVITPSQHLTPQRPLALLAWGKRLEMSVVDDTIVAKFIKDNAKQGFRAKQQKLKLSPKLYEAGLLTEAHLVTDEQDKEICGYKTNEII